MDEQVFLSQSSEVGPFTPLNSPLTGILVSVPSVPANATAASAKPFDHPDWIFECKYDGFRALGVIEHGRTQLFSRNGHRFTSFATLEELISAGLPDTRAVIDGEICSLDKRGSICSCVTARIADVNACLTANRNYAEC